jgi:peptidoglycan/LPS O-acetylase OafA/YrhL
MSGSTTMTTPSPSPIRSDGYIPGFDGLRAIAVLLVLVAHAQFGNVVPGGLGVTIFFAISGYLITTLILNEVARTGRLDLKLFYARRVLRLYPELVVFIVICLIVGPILSWQATIWEKFAGLFYYMNYYYVFGVQRLPEDSYQWRQLWSLAVEEHYYIFFPGLLILAGKFPNGRRIFISALIVVPYIWRFYAYYGLGLPWEYNYVATDARIDSIAWGCLLALMMHEQANGGGGVRRPFYIRPWLVPLALGVLLFSLVWRDEGFRWTWRFTLQGAALFLLIGNLLFDPFWRRIVTVLEHPVPRFLGRISYSLYLYHMLLNAVLLRFMPMASRIQFLAVSLVLSVLVASISYRMLEVPLKPLRRRLGSHVR